MIASLTDAKVVINEQAEEITWLRKRIRDLEVVRADHYEFTALVTELKGG